MTISVDPVVAQMLIIVAALAVAVYLFVQMSKDPPP